MFSTPEYDGFSVDAKVLKLFDEERQESTCNIHVTWTTDSVMGLDKTSPFPVLVYYAGEIGQMMRQLRLHELTPQTVPAIYCTYQRSKGKRITSLFLFLYSPSNKFKTQKFKILKAKQ
jgi:hypothetical protein